MTTTRWEINARGQVGNYSDDEVRNLVRKGLSDALVRPEGGEWVHVPRSPFAPLVTRPPKGPSVFLWLAVIVSAVFLMWFFGACGRVVVFTG